MTTTAAPRIAVLIPCFNEALTIGNVVRDFAGELPDAAIFVYDNNSTDKTSEMARSGGATVRREPAQGKGNVVRRMFADVDADIYVLVDGDGTYEASEASALIEQLLSEHLDLVVAKHVGQRPEAYRPGHEFGNKLLTALTGRIFGQSFTDTLSGYRVMSRRFVKSFPAHSNGFDTETELAVHALELRMPAAERPCRYLARPHGSHSKLNTWRDGWRIFWTITKLAKNGRPLAFFSTGSVLCTLLALVLAWPVFVTYLATGLVPRLPTAVLCAALVLLAGIFLVCGLVLDTVTLGRREMKYMVYLDHPRVGDK